MVFIRLIVMWCAHAVEVDGVYSSHRYVVRSCCCRDGWFVIIYQIKLCHLRCNYRCRNVLQKGNINQKTESCSREGPHKSYCKLYELRLTDRSLGNWPPWKCFEFQNTNGRSLITLASCCTCYFYTVNNDIPATVARFHWVVTVCRFAPLVSGANRAI